MNYLQVFPYKNEHQWLQHIVFNSDSSEIRELFTSILSNIFNTNERKLIIIKICQNLLRNLDKVAKFSTNFLNFFKSIALESPMKEFLILHGTLDYIIVELNKQTKKILIQESEKSVTYCKSASTAIFIYADLISMFWKDDSFKVPLKSELCGILRAYLDLKKIIFARSLLIDCAEENLAQFIEEVTSTNETDTSNFITALISIIKNCANDDIKTPIYAFEKLYTLINRSESNAEEIFVNLEKDPLQEEFLQGRMLSNPYSSAENGIGPLFRDIKNRICRDCDLIALLEDDNSMELLVNNKIINLDLSLLSVYKYLWLKNGGSREAIRIVYRMRGLLGDATEEFVETLEDSDQSDETNYEELYKMSRVMADCGGIQLMLSYFDHRSDSKLQETLLIIILKLLDLCVKVNQCQIILCSPEAQFFSITLRVSCVYPQVTFDSNSFHINIFLF